MGSDLRKTFNTTFDNVRQSFAGLDAHSERVIYGIELVEELQRSLYSYILNQGPRPTLHVEDAAFGHYSSLNSASEGEFPRVVTQQDNSNGNGETETSVAQIPSDYEGSAESEWANDPGAPVRSLRDRITDVMRDRETG